MQSAKYEMQNEERKNQGSSWDDLQERLLDFAVRIGAVVDSLPDTRLGRHTAGQLVRCGTSAPPNYAEACGAESKKDFIHKLGICLKELRESCVWLRLIIKSQMLTGTRLNPLLDEGKQLTNIIGKSNATAKGTSKTPSNAVTPQDISF